MPFNGGPKSRLISILNLLNLLRGVQIEKKLDLLGRIVGALLEMNEDDSGVDKRRYFTGSQVHRVKQRVVQALLIFQPLLNLVLNPKP